MEPSVFQYLTFMSQQVTIAPGSVTVEPPDPKALPAGPLYAPTVEQEQTP
jgi:hypothetical protein